MAAPVSSSSPSATVVPSMSSPFRPSNASRARHDFWGNCVVNYSAKQRFGSLIGQVAAVAATPQMEEQQVVSRPTWTDFELGKAPVFWKTSNGLSPASGEELKLFYNPAAKGFEPNDDFGIGFNGGFNQPIMCGSELRTMTRKSRGPADSPIYTIRIRVPKHAVNLIFSFTNGVDWDGPYKLQFQVSKNWQNKPMEFFNEGLALELSMDGACDRAIFPDANKVVNSSCEIGSLYSEGGDRCKLDLVPGCMDPSSPLFDPFANVDDGSCPIDVDSDSE